MYDCLANFGFYGSLTVIEMFQGYLTPPYGHIVIVIIQPLLQFHFATETPDSRQASSHKIGPKAAEIDWLAMENPLSQGGVAKSDPRWAPTSELPKSIFMFASVAYAK